MMRMFLAVSLATVLFACQRDGAGGSAPASAPATPAPAPAASAREAHQTHTATHAAAPVADGHSCEGSAAHAKTGEEHASCGQVDEANPEAGCNQWDDEAAEISKRAVPDGATWVAFDVDGMTCGGCERRIIANVGELEGVVAVEASAELGRVRVALAPGKDAARDAARDRIAQLGYKLR
jgi:copper chaperone CopZ